MKQLVLIFFSVFLLFSCKLQEETVIPFAEPETISEIQQAILMATNGSDFKASSISYYQVEGDTEHFYLKLRYKMDRITTDELEEAEQELSKVSKSILGLFAKIFSKFGKHFDVDIPDIDLEIPELTYDKDIIVDVKLSKIHLEFYHPNKHNNFKFIDQLDFKIVNNSTEKHPELILGYETKRNKCKFKCIDFDIYKTSLSELIGDNKKLKIRTKLKINKLPKKLDLTFKGYVELFVKLKLPF